EPAGGASSRQVFGSGGVASAGPARNDLRKSAFSGLPAASRQPRSTTSVYALPASSTGPASSRGFSPVLIRPGANTSVNRVPDGSQSSSPSSRNGSSIGLPFASSRRTWSYASPRLIGAENSM